MVLRTVAISLFAIYIPIFFYERGESATNIFMYFFIAYLVEAAFEVFSTILYREIGLKKTIIGSIPILILYLWMVATLSTYDWPLWLLGLVVGISLAFFWQPYQYMFSKYKSKEKTSRQVSARVSAVAILTAVTPLLGGYIIERFGSSYLLLLAIVLLVLASLLFSLGKDTRVSESFDVRQIKIAQHKKEIIAYMGYTLEETAAYTLWPFFVFLLVGSYKTVGGLMTITLGLTVIVTLAVGKLSDSGKRTMFIKEGSLMSVLINLGRAASSSLYHVFIVNIFRSLTTSIFASPFLSEYYLHADEEIRDEYIFIVELASDIARVLYFGLIIVASIYLPLQTTLIFAFILSAVGAFLSGLMPPSKRDLVLKSREIKLMPRPKKASGIELKA